MIDIILIALALSMDAFAVSVSSGIVIHKRKVAHAMRFGLTFGFFQMIMPVLGWMAGRGFYHLIEHAAHWLAFGLLFFIGAKMIYEATKLEAWEKTPPNISTIVLLGLGIATSIDALATGLSLSFLNVPIVGPAIVIGAITLCMSCLGFFVGDRFGHIFERKAEIAAGLLLIAIGFKILWGHL